MATNHIVHNSIIKLKDRDAFVNLLISELVKHGLVKVTALGVFKLKHMKAHTRYIVGTGKIGKVPARIKLSFTPTKAFRVAIQKWKTTKK